MKFWPGEILRTLRRIDVTVIDNNKHLTQLEEHLMKIDDMLAQLDTDTTATATRVTDLIASIKASGQTLTAAQEAEAAAITGHLQAIGTDPVTPIPPPPPVTPGL